MLPVPAGGGTFLLRQESTQRMRHRRGAELFAPANKAALSYVPHPARLVERNIEYFGSVFGGP